MIHSPIEMSKLHSNAIAGRGADQLSRVQVDTYNAELRDSEGFIGDRACKRAFRSMLEHWRERQRKFGNDPLGEIRTEKITKNKIDKILLKGSPKAASLVYSAVEEFAQELAVVIRRLLGLQSWRETQRILIGGGFSRSRAGQLAIGRAEIILQRDGYRIVLIPIRHHPDQAGLIGAAYLAPSQVCEEYKSILAVDIGGSKIRTGIVDLNLKKNAFLSSPEVRFLDIWRHADEKLSRDEAVERLAGMLHELVKYARKRNVCLAPFVGIACPGLIAENGSILRGGQNLPGDWESTQFNLPRELTRRIRSLGDNHLRLVMHNDAVVQGLSHLPFMRDIVGWGALTIGTGLGNAHFTNRIAPKGYGDRTSQA